MLNPLQALKLRLMTHGVEVTPEARAVLAGHGADRPLTLADYASTSGISMRLAGTEWVNAPIADHNPNFVSAPVDRLMWTGSSFRIEGKAGTWDAEPMPVPAYHDRRSPAGEAYTSYAHTHTDRVRISPVEGCAIACTFCDLPYEYRYRTKSLEGLVDSVRVALGDPWLPARHILISGGTPRREDYGYLLETYGAVCAAFPAVDVDVMMTPMPNLLDPRHLREIGVNGLSINLELWNEAASRRIMPGKSRIGRQGYARFLADAVACFGPGKVRSLLLVGIEPLDDTLEAVALLADLGVDPVLSPFRPDPSTPMRDHRPPGIAFLEEAYARSVEIVERRPEVRLGPRCLPCTHNTLTFAQDLA